MKIISHAFSGIILSLITTLILVYRIENGDINAIGMYLVVFFIPIILLSFLNAIYISLIAKVFKRSLKILFAFIPIFILIVISFVRNLYIPLFDFDISFVATIASIALGILNLFWFFRVLTNEVSRSK